jgi:hypothetical protein
LNPAAPNCIRIGCYRRFPIISVGLGEGRLTSPPMVAKRPTRELVASGVRGLPAQAASVFRVDIVHHQLKPGLHEVERHRPAHIAQPDNPTLPAIASSPMTETIVAQDYGVGADGEITFVE